MENNRTNIKERVLQIAKHNKISYELFFKDLSLSYGNFKGKAKNSPLNSDAIATILTKYNDISADWLLLGIGAMKKNNNIQNPHSPTDANSWQINRDIVGNSQPLNSNNLEYELKTLKNIIFEKDTQLSLKDEIIKSKDEIIKLLKEKAQKHRE